MNMHQWALEFRAVALTGGVPPDRPASAMDAETLGAFERAAEEVQSGDEGTRAAAEAVLLALRESPAVVASSQAVLAQTSSAVAQFQALLALKEGVLREWGTTAPAQVDALRTQVRSVLPL